MQANQTTSRADADAKKLRRHFRLTLDDLEQNRRGLLSEKQKARIAGYERGGRILGVAVGAMLLVLSAAFVPLVSTAMNTILGSEALRQYAA